MMINTDDPRHAFILGVIDGKCCGSDGGPDEPESAPSHLTGTRCGEYWRGYAVGFSEARGDWALVHKVQP